MEDGSSTQNDSDKPKKPENAKKEGLIFKPLLLREQAYAILEASYLTGIILRFPNVTLSGDAKQQSIYDGFPLFDDLWKIVPENPVMDVSKGEKPQATISSQPSAVALDEMWDFFSERKLFEI
jgi:hypothetical protein